MSSSRAPVGWRSARILGLVLATSMLVALPGAVCAQSELADDQLRTVTVSGVGQTAVDPDQAVVRVGVTTRAAGAKAAGRRAANRMDSVLAALRDLGIDEADLRTTRVSMRPYRERRNGEVVESGWLVSNRIKVTVRDIAQTGDVIDAAVEAGANDLDGVSFRASDPSAAVSESRAKAVVAAEAAATELAEAAGVEVLGLLSIVEGDAGYSFATRNGAFFAAETAGPTYDTPIEPGTIDIGVTVKAVYQVG